jgi:predicted nucleic-acid-binding protein
MGGRAVKVTVDTNLLVRSAVRDDQQQARAADRILRTAETVAVSLSCLCEFVWVLSGSYRFGRAEIAHVIVSLCDAPNVVVNRPAVDEGLAMLRAGGDFADGVVAYEGRWLGGETFVSFDKKAVSLLTKQGSLAKLVTDKK